MRTFYKTKIKKKVPLSNFKSDNQKSLMKQIIVSPKKSVCEVCFLQAINDESRTMSEENSRRWRRGRKKKNSIKLLLKF